MRRGRLSPAPLVTARHTETNLTGTTTSDQDGRFRFPYLRVGPYELTVASPGFRQARRTLTLTAGAAFELPVSLAVAGLDASVTVTAEATGRSKPRAARSRRRCRRPRCASLPMNGRNFLDLALLVPGVSPTNVASTQLFPETSAVPGVSLSVGSQRNLSNNFIVDGLSANDDAAALSGITYGVDAIEQFQVVTSGGQAELGRALGGYVNVVTKSGTNALHGTVYDYFRDDRFNAANALSGTTLPMNQQQYGGSVGGPIVPRTARSTSPTSSSGDLDQTGLTTITEASVAADQRAAGGGGLSAARWSRPACIANPVDSTNVLAQGRSPGAAAATS